MRIMLLSMVVLLPAGLFAQKKTAESTEIYSPVPPVVTPGEGTNPPSDALILFDGKNFNEWEGKEGIAVEWTLSQGIMTVKPSTGDIRSRKSFGDCQLHVEWSCPEETPHDGHGYGNSGILIQGRYEVQIFNSYNYPVYMNNKPIYTNGQAGSIYKQVIPLVNACKKNGQWQVFDIIFMAPRFNEKGRVAIPARITVFHNNVLILNNFEIQGTIKYIGAPEYEVHGLKEPLVLQEHGDPVSFRNKRIREL